MDFDNYVKSLTAINDLSTNVNEKKNLELPDVQAYDNNDFFSTFKQLSCMRRQISQLEEEIKCDNIDLMDNFTRISGEAKIAVTCLPDILSGVMQNAPEIKRALQAPRKTEFISLPYTKHRQFVSTVEALVELCNEFPEHMDTLENQAPVNWTEVTAGSELYENCVKRLNILAENHVKNMNYCRRNKHIKHQVINSPTG